MRKSSHQEFSLIREISEFIKIVLLTGILGIIIGVVNDLQVIKISFNYFKYLTSYYLCHSPEIQEFLFLNKDEPEVWACVWGFLGTWQLSLILGVFFAFSARFVLSFQLVYSDLILPIILQGILLIGAADYFGKRYILRVTTHFNYDDIFYYLRNRFYTSEGFLDSFTANDCINFLIADKIISFAYGFTYFFAIFTHFWILYKRLSKASEFSKSVHEMKSEYQGAFPSYYDNHGAYWY